MEMQMFIPFNLAQYLGNSGLLMVVILDVSVEDPMVFVHLWIVLFPASFLVCTAYYLTYLFF